MKAMKHVKKAREASLKRRADLAQQHADTKWYSFKRRSCNA